MFVWEGFNTMKKKNLLVITAAIIILLLLATSAGASTATATTQEVDQLDYSEIAGIVKDQNIQIQSAQLSLDKLQDSIEKVEDSLDNVEYVSDSIDLNSLYSQLGTTKIAVQKTEDLLINTAQNYFVSYNQLRYNLPVAAEGIELLKTSVVIAEVNYKYGLGTKVDVDNAKIQLASAESQYLSIENQMSVLSTQLKILLDLDPQSTLEIGDVPAADRDYLAVINQDTDMTLAMVNSYTLKTILVEATYSPSSRKINLLSIEQAERDAKATCLRNYAALGEQSAKTELTQQKLTQAGQTLNFSEQRYTAGLISKLALATAKNSYASAKADAENEEAALFWEIESYKAMISGLL